MNLDSTQKSSLVFVSAFIVAGIILSTVIFPFWHLIREDVLEDTVILTNDDGICYVETADRVPKTIRDCTSSPGDKVTIKFGKDLAWATIIP